MSGTMLSALAHVCRQAREQAGRKRYHVAARVGHTEKTIERFETGRTWPKDIEAMVDAYAQEAGLEPVELWLRAIEYWRDDP